MAILNDEVKTEIVKALASFCGYEETARHIRERFGIAIERFQVRAYDPTSCGFSAGDKWQTIFEHSRRAFLQQIKEVPIAHAGYRLGELQRLYDRARIAGNSRLAMRVLRDAAIEAGSLDVRRTRSFSA